MPPAASLIVSSHPGLPGVVVARAEGVTAAFPRHVHASHVAGLVLAGGRRLILGKRELSAAPGAVFVIPAGTPHACAPLDPAGQSYLAVAMAPQVLIGLRPHDAASDHDARVLTDPDAARMLQDLAEALAAASPQAPSRLAELAEALKLPPIGAIAPPHPAAARAKALLDAASDHTPSLTELAEAAGVSPHYLERVFARDLGVPPGEYGLDRRVKTALEYLLAGSPPAEAALAAGFFDQSHLHRHFRRRMGVPPGRVKGKR